MKYWREPVKCGSCKWRGKRKIGECACYDEYALYCACAWGYCPKCGQGYRVYPTRYLREWLKHESLKPKPTEEQK